MIDIDILLFLSIQSAFMININSPNRKLLASINQSSSGLLLFSVVAAG